MSLKTFGPYITFERVDVDSDYRMSSTVPRPKGQDQYSIEILHVFAGPIDPRHRSMFSTHKVDLNTIGEDYAEPICDIDESSCNEIEKQLAHLPDPKALEKHKEFSWDHRTLVKARDLEAGKKDGVELADYLMYVCLDENAGLRENEFLGSLVAYAPKVYGGAWIFKKTTDSGEPDGKEIAAYLQSSEDDLNKKNKLLFVEGILTSLMEELKYGAVVNGCVQS